jgi:S-adenosylmethionine hydrolase
LTTDFGLKDGNVGVMKGVIWGISPRRAIAARLGPYRFVGPDNGVITSFLETAEESGWPVEFFALDQPQFWLPEVSHIFHGRDIFAPVAGHLATGVPLENMGEKINDPVLVQFSRPQRTENRLIGEIVYVDNFGNLISNIQRSDLHTQKEIDVSLGGVMLHGLAETFGDQSAGEFVALYSSVGDLMVSVVNGSARDRLQLKSGDPIEVHFQD